MIFKLHNLDSENNFVNERDVSSDSLTRDVTFDEIAFDLQRVNIPNYVTIEFNNTEGEFSPQFPFYRDFNSDLIFFSAYDDRDQNLLFRGIVVDITYSDTSAKFKISNALYLLLNRSLFSFSETNITPSELILRLLLSSGLPTNLIDFDNFSEINFIQSTFTDISSRVGVNISNNQIPDSQRLMIEGYTETIEGRETQLYKLPEDPTTVFLPFSEQKLNLEIAEETSLTDILKELAKMTGVFIYTQNSIFKLAYFPFLIFQSQPVNIDRRQIKGAKSSYGTPSLWRRSSLSVPFKNGENVQQVSTETITDLSGIGLTLNSVNDQIAGKTEKVTGLDGKLTHASETSVRNSIYALLLLRGIKRHRLKIQVVSTEGDELSMLSLFQPITFNDLDYVAKGFIISKKVKSTQIDLEILTANDGYIYNQAIQDLITGRLAEGIRFYTSTETSLVDSGISYGIRFQASHRFLRHSVAYLRIGDLYIIANHDDVKRTVRFSDPNKPDIVLNQFDFLTSPNPILNESYQIITTLSEKDGLEYIDDYDAINFFDITNYTNLLLTDYFPILATDETGIGETV